MRSRGRTEYSQMLSSMAQEGPLSVDKLVSALSDRWCAAYRDATAAPTNILEFDYGSYSYLFDFPSELVPKGILSDQAVEDRVVAAYGRSQRPSSPRDANRIRGFPLPPLIPPDEPDDRGHLLGHAQGGLLDVNLFPQRRSLNRGWSRQGRLFRRMERYCSRNEGTFCFARPYVYRSLLETVGDRVRHPGGAGPLGRVVRQLRRLVSGISPLL